DSDVCDVFYLSLSRYCLRSTLFPYTTLFRSLYDLGNASLLTFLYLIFILFQGSLYWFYRYMLIVSKRKVNSKVINLLKLVRGLNIFLLIMVGITVPFVRSSMTDLIIALGIFLFGIIEYINYY